MPKVFQSMLLFCLVCGPVAASSVDDIVFMTEQYPPYNLEKDGKLQGIAVDILTLMLHGMGSKQAREDIKLLPWARGYKRTLAESNTCLFSTTRTAERENLFKWVGPIAPNTVSLIARKDRNLEIASTEDLKKHKIGTIRDDVAEAHLTKAGISLDEMERVSESLLNIKKLNRGRIDLWAYGENVAMWELKANGFDPADYEVVHVLDDSKELYFALNKDTTDTVIRELQAAIDKLRADGEIDQILDRYLR